MTKNKKSLMITKKSQSNVKTRIKPAETLINFFMLKNCSTMLKHATKTV